MSVTLAETGDKMPLVGFGAWKVGTDTCADTIYGAIKAGYRLIDGAQIYENEKECGDGVRRAIKEGIVKREDMFIVTKIWNIYHDKENVVPAIRRSLQDWGLDYFDLVLVHFPLAQKFIPFDKLWPAAPPEIVYDRVPLYQTWEGMEDAVRHKITRNIGVSNYSVGLLRDLLSYAKIRPASLQVEHHPLLTQPDLIEYAQSENIAVTAYSSFGPQSFVEMKLARAVGTTKLFENDTIVAIAKTHNKSPAQVILRWCTQRNIAVIPKSNSPQRVIENFASQGFNLTQDELEQISGLDKGLRFNNPKDWPVPAAIF